MNKIAKTLGVIVLGATMACAPILSKNQFKINQETVLNLPPKKDSECQRTKKTISCTRRYLDGKMEYYLNDGKMPICIGKYSSEKNYQWAVLHDFGCNGSIDLYLGVLGNNPKRQKRVEMVSEEKQFFDNLYAQVLDEIFE